MSMNGNIKAARMKRRLSQRDAAGKLKISPVHLCMVEKGNSEPSLRLLKRMAQVYGVRLQSFLKGCK